MQGISQTKDAIILEKALEADIGPHLVVVKGSADGGVALPGGADVQWMGVTIENGLSGEKRKVVVGGGVIVKIKAAAAIAEGANVSIHGTTGKIKTAAPSTGANSFVVGKAMEAAANDGDIIGVLLTPGVVMQGA